MAEATPYVKPCPICRRYCRVKIARGLTFIICKPCTVYYSVKAAEPEERWRADCIHAPEATESPS